MILRWSAVLGVVGFLSGFIGPMLLAPDANQGPMLGIFITGPGGAVLGAVLGAIVAALGWPLPTSNRILAAIAITLAAGTLYICVPAPTHLATLADGEIRSCTGAESLKDGAVARLRDIEASRPGQTSTPWNEKFDRALTENAGLVVQVHIFRIKHVLERQARWNRGTVLAGPWTPVDKTSSFLVDRSQGDCSSFVTGTRSVFALNGNTNRWPPHGVAEMLGIQVAGALPAKYSTLAKDR